MQLAAVCCLRAQVHLGTHTTHACSATVRELLDRNSEQTAHNY